MSTCFDIRSATASYSVRIEAGLFQSVLQQQGHDILIADEWFSSALAAAGREAIIIPANESAKSLDAIPELIVALRKHGANRQTALIALGGGIVQDVTAFVASVYMRGVKWTYFPTTLLAMADSCIGGKSSINVGPYKNIVGTFHPPQSVLIDPALALTLSDENRIGGLVEAVKICFCRGDAAFQEYMALEPQVTMSVDQVEQLLICSLRAKKWFIEVDEFDKAERLLLNFGHTFGHAIEGASNFRIQHGVGVGVGILCAIELGQHLGRTYAGAAQVQTLELHLRSLLLGVPALRDHIANLSISDVLDRFQADKKHGMEYFAVILIAESGAVEILQLPKGMDSLGVIQTAIENVMTGLTASYARDSRNNEI